MLCVFCGRTRSGGRAQASHDCRYTHRVLYRSGLEAPPGFISEIGTLLPIAPCGRKLLYRPITQWLSPMPWLARCAASRRSRRLTARQTRRGVRAAERKRRYRALRRAARRTFVMSSLWPRPPAFAPESCLSAVRAVTSGTRGLVISA